MKYYRIYQIKSGKNLYLLPDLNSFSGSAFGVWEEDKAKNIIKSLIKNKKYGGINFYLESASAKKKEDDEQGQGTQAKYLMSCISDFKKTEADKRRQTIEKIRNEENAIMDILHFIELDNEDSVKRNAERYVMQIRKHRQTRREYKDSLKLMDKLNHMLPDEITQHIDQELEFLQTRKYTPRIYQ